MATRDDGKKYDGTGTSHGNKRNRRRRKKPMAEPKYRFLTTTQTDHLERHFDANQNVDTARKQEIASSLRLDKKQVRVWFQNRRSRMRGAAKVAKQESELNRRAAKRAELESQLKIAREELAESDRRYRQISQGVRVGVGVASESSDSSDSNEYDEDLYNWPELYK